MASIYIGGNDQLGPDKLWAGSRINPVCYIGNTVFYGDEEEVRDIESYELSSYSTGDKLFATGSNYCTIRIKLRKYRQKKNGTFVRTIWSKSNVIPTEVHCLDEDGHELVKYDASTGKISWNNADGATVRTELISEGLKDITVYYQNTESIVVDVYDDAGNKTGTTTVTASDPFQKTFEDAIKLQGNRINTVYSFSEDISVSETTDSWGTSSKKVPASGSYNSLGSIVYPVKIFCAAVYKETKWTSGVTEGQNRVTSLSNVYIANTISDEYGHVEEEKFVHYSNTEYDDQCKDYKYTLNSYYDGNYFYCYLPSLENFQISNGFYYLQIGIPSDGGDFSDAISNKIQIYQETNQPGTSSYSYSDWKYSIGTTGNYVNVNESAGIELPYYAGSRDVYFTAKVYRGYTFTSGYEVGQEVSAKTSSESGGGWYIQRDSGNNFYYSSTYQAVQVPIPQNTNTSDDFYSITLMYDNNDGASALGTVIITNKRAPIYALSISGANSSGIIEIPAGDSYILEITSTLEGEYYEDVEVTYLTPGCSIGSKTHTEGTTLVSIPVNLIPNTSRSEPSDCIFTIEQTGGKTKTITIRQEPVPNDYEIDYNSPAKADGKSYAEKTIEAGTNMLASDRGFSIAIVSKKNGEAFKPDDIRNWITFENNDCELAFSKAELQGSGSYIYVFLTFSYSENVSTSSTRSSVIKIRQKDTSVYPTYEDDDVLEYHITQKAATASAKLVWEWYQPQGGTTYTIKVSNIGNATANINQIMVQHTTGDYTQWNTLNTSYSGTSIAADTSSYLLLSNITFNKYVQNPPSQSTSIFEVQSYDSNYTVSINGTQIDLKS